VIEVSNEQSSSADEVQEMLSLMRGFRVEGGDFGACITSEQFAQLKEKVRPYIEILTQRCGDLWNFNDTFKADPDLARKQVDVLIDLLGKLDPIRLASDPSGALAEVGWLWRKLVEISRIQDYGLQLPIRKD
jgi:hypothetical protein